MKVNSSPDILQVNSPQNIETCAEIDCYLLKQIYPGCIFSKFSVGCLESPLEKVGVLPFSEFLTHF